MPACHGWQVSKDGKVVGAMELGLSSIADKVVFGRAPTCDVVLEHLSISRQHAALSTDTAGNLFITDLGSGALPHSVMWAVGGASDYVLCSYDV